MGEQNSRVGHNKEGGFMGIYEEKTINRNRNRKKKIEVYNCKHILLLGITRQVHVCNGEFWIWNQFKP